MTNQKTDPIQLLTKADPMSDEPDCALITLTPELLMKVMSRFLLIDNVLDLRVDKELRSICFHDDGEAIIWFPAKDRIRLPEEDADLFDNHGGILRLDDQQYVDTVAAILRTKSPMKSGMMFVSHTDIWWSGHAENGVSFDTPTLPRQLFELWVEGGGE